MAALCLWSVWTALRGRMGKTVYYSYNAFYNIIPLFTSFSIQNAQLRANTWNRHDPSLSAILPAPKHLWHVHRRLLQYLVTHMRVDVRRGLAVRVADDLHALPCDFFGFNLILLKSIYSESNGFLCVYDGLWPELSKMSVRDGLLLMCQRVDFSSWSGKLKLDTRADQVG